VRISSTVRLGPRTNIDSNNLFQSNKYNSFGANINHYIYFIDVGKIMQFFLLLLSTNAELNTLANEKLMNSIMN
jgi:hypothetical protein